MSDGYLPRIETGRDRPDSDMLRSIARALAVPYMELAIIVGYADETPDMTPDLYQFSAFPDAIKKFLIDIGQRVADLPMRAYLADPAGDLPDGDTDTDADDDLPDDDSPRP
jgi:hypothetical protein